VAKISVAKIGVSGGEIGEKQCAKIMAAASAWHVSSNSVAMAAENINQYHA